MSRPSAFLSAPRYVDYYFCEIGFQLSGCLYFSSSASVSVTIVLVDPHYSVSSIKSGLWSVLLPVSSTLLITSRWSIIVNELLRVGTFYLDFFFLFFFLPANLRSWLGVCGQLC